MPSGEAGKQISILREREIRDIEAKVAEVNEIFKELAVLVNEQHELVGR
jgi:t-SNARE complex subunit (syntaxin)